MRKTLLIPFFTCLLLCACKKKTIIEKELETLEIVPENYHDIDTLFYENQKIKSLHFHQTETTYTAIYFYESGKKKFIGAVKNDQTNGEYIDWYENGNQKWIRQYHLGNQIGKSIHFRENGTIEEQYNNDNQEFTYYWENENPKSKFVGDKLQYYYYTNGNLMEKYDIIDKNELDATFFNENGEAAFTGNFKSDTLYKDGIKYNGKVIWYFNTGKIASFSKYIDGIQDGKCYGYYGNGSLKFENEYENGKEKYYKAYYENGKIHFIRDGINETFTSWDKNGNLQE